MFNRRQFLAGTSAVIAAPAIATAQNSGVFRVGALNPITGAGSPYGTGMQKMLLAAAEIVNAQGGAAGRRIEVVAEDSQSNPQAGVLAAKKLIEVNQVRAILGTWSSGVSLAVAPLTNAANILLMHGSGAPALSVPPANEKGLLYRFQATNSRWGRAYAQVLKREGFKRPATMAFNNAAGLSMIESFTADWKKSGGEIASSVVYEPNQVSYRSELQRVLAANPDVIVMGSYLSDTTIILREWYQFGQPVKWVAPLFAANAELAKALGEDVVEGVMAVDSVSNEKAPSFAEYDAAYKKAMNGISGLTNVSGAMCWDMMNVVALAIESAKSFEMAAINEHIRKVSNPDGEKVYSFADGKRLLSEGRKINYEGASSVLDFDQFGDVNPQFGMFKFEAGAINRKYVVEI